MQNRFLRALDHTQPSIPALNVSGTPPWLVASLLLSGGLFSHPVHAQSADEVSVRAQLEWEPGSLGGRRSTSIELGTEAPAGLELPANVKDMRYAGIPLGDREVLHVVVDLTSGRERIWIDHDFDGEFRDNPYSQWERRGAAISRTETVLVPFSTEEAPVPVEIRLGLRRMADRASLSLVVDAHKTGEVILGDRVRSIALHDETNQLRFDDGRGVVLFLDANGDGKFETQHGSPEHLHLGDSFRLGEEGWTFRLTDPAGTVIEFLRLAEAPPPVERTWQRQRAPAFPYRLAVPAESFEVLAQRFDEEQARPYVDRYATVRAIGATGTSPAFELLASVGQKDEDPRIRVAAVAAMGNAAFLVDHGEEIAKLLRDDDPKIAAAAVGSLYKIGFPTFEERVLPLIASRDDEVASAAVQYLGYLDSPASREQVTAAAREHDAATVRHRAYSALRTHSDGPPVELILACAHDNYQNLRALALTDLYSLGHPEALQLALEAVDTSTVNPTLVNAASLILVAAGDEMSIDAVVTMGMRATANNRAPLITRLSRLRSNEAVGVFLEGLASRNKERRGFCAQILASISTPEVAKDLATQLRREKDTDTATWIIAALGEQEGKEATKALLRAAKKKGPLRGPSVRSLARMGIDDPNVRRFLLGLLGSNTWQDTVYAVDAAAASGKVELGHKILPELRHKRWEVRLAVVQALRRLRSPEWVEPLIDYLEKEDRPRVRNEIADTLFELTGVRIYTDAAVWRRWWREHGDSFTMPATIPEIPKARPGDTIGGFYGLPVTSDRLIFVIDQSGSMSARDTSGQEETISKRRTRLEQAVAQTIQAMSSMDDEDQVNVVLFESSYHRWQDGLVPLIRKNREKLEAFLNRQRPMGGTNLYDALELALQDPDVDTVILLSDGQPGAGRYVAADDILRAVARINQTRRITIHCVSLGRESQLLQQLAEAHGGRYVRR